MTLRSFAAVIVDSWMSTRTLLLSRPRHIVAIEGGVPQGIQQQSTPSVVACSQTSQLSAPMADPNTSATAGRLR